MIYQQRIPTVEADQILTSSQAAAITGYAVAEPAAGEDWAIEWTMPTAVGNLTAHLGGRVGDFLYQQEDRWIVVGQATFLAGWEPVDIDLRTSDLRESELR